MPVRRLVPTAARTLQPLPPAQAPRSQGSAAQSAAGAGGFLADDAAPADSFIDRARELVTFLAQNHRDPRAGRLREEQLAAWIAHWQRASHACPGREEHFLAEELGIIVRALSGPAPVAQLAGDNEAFRWVIARCMTLS